MTTAADLTKLSKFLGHERFAVKSVQTGKNGAQEAHFDLINANKAADYIKIRNRKRQLWINVQRLKADPAQYHTHEDVDAYTNIFIDIDANKPDDKKDYAATEKERGLALAQLPTVRAWLNGQGFKPGLAFESGNGAGLLLPIPPTPLTAEFIAKAAAFLKVVKAKTGCDVDTTTFDPPRVCGILGTLNVKLEDEAEGRKNRLRVPLDDIPTRDEDAALLKYIKRLEPDTDALAAWTKKLNEPTPTEDEVTQAEVTKAEIPTNQADVDFVAQKLKVLLEADAKLQSLLDWSDEEQARHKGDRSNAEFGLVGKLISAGFTDPEIDWIMTNVSKIGKWAESPEHYRHEMTLRKLRERDKEEAATTQQIEHIDADIMSEARRILETEDPVEYALSTFNTLHKGDKTAGGITYCCCLTPQIETSRGAHPKLTGKSGGGKSDMAEAVLHTLPSEAYIKTGLSPKALMYHPIRAGTIVFCDDYKQNDDVDAILKQTSSNFHEPYTHRTVKRGKPATMHAPPEIVWMITSVDSDQDIQVLNRAVPIDVDESEVQDKAVAGHVLKLAAEGEVARPVTHDVMVTRAMFRILKSKRYRVKIPFALDIEWNDAGNRRNLPLFLDILQAVTFWRRFQRDVDEEGKLLAKVEDFDLAKDLYVGDGRGEGFKTKLTGAERKLVKLIVEEGGRLEQQRAAKLMEVTSGRITQLVNGKDPKKDGGILHKDVPGFSVVRESIDEGGRSKWVNVLYLEKFDVWRDAETVVSLRHREKWE